MALVGEIIMLDVDSIPLHTIRKFVEILKIGFKVINFMNLLDF